VYESVSGWGPGSWLVVVFPALFIRENSLRSLILDISAGATNDERSELPNNRQKGCDDGEIPNVPPDWRKLDLPIRPHCQISGPGRAGSQRFESWSLASEEGEDGTDQGQITATG
jgi:hypothetical protein